MALTSALMQYSSSSSHSVEDKTTVILYVADLLVDVNSNPLKYLDLLEEGVFNLFVFLAVVLMMRCCL